jgi:hypothetical protein
MSQKKKLSGPISGASLLLTHTGSLSSLVEGLPYQCTDSTEQYSSFIINSDAEPDLHPFGGAGAGSDVSSSNSYVSHIRYWYRYTVTGTHSKIASFETKMLNFFNLWSLFQILIKTWFWFFHLKNIVVPVINVLLYIPVPVEYSSRSMGHLIFFFFFTWSRLKNDAGTGTGIQ